MRAAATTRASQMHADNHTGPCNLTGTHTDAPQTSCHIARAIPRRDLPDALGQAGGSALHKDFRTLDLSRSEHERRVRGGLSDQQIGRTHRRQADGSQAAAEGCGRLHDSKHTCTALEIGVRSSDLELALERRLRLSIQASRSAAMRHRQRAQVGSEAHLDHRVSRVGRPRRAGRP